jgi:hypothetical protein
MNDLRAKLQLQVFNNSDAVVTAFRKHDVEMKGALSCAKLASMFQAIGITSVLREALCLAKSLDINHAGYVPFYVFEIRMLVPFVSIPPLRSQMTSPRGSQVHALFSMQDALTLC